MLEDSSTMVPPATGPEDGRMLMTASCKGHSSSMYPETNAPIAPPTEPDTVSTSVFTPVTKRPSPLPAVSPRTVLL